MEKMDFDTIPARVLNYSSRILLGKFLNPEKKILSTDKYARDYRGLAEQMQFGFNDIENFRRRDDPTVRILEEWTVQSDATIGKLIMFLENMERHDVIQDLTPHFENDAKIYLQQKEICTECPLQVPEVTSGPSQSSQMIEPCVLTREDVSTGRPTYYDVYISYADEDMQFVYYLLRYLESNGFKVFVRSRDLLAGHSEYKTNLQLIQERCNRVLIVLSPNFIKSAACEVQATFAVCVGSDENCRKIVPILVQPCESIPWLLKYRNIIDFTKPGIQEWVWDILKSSLRDVSSPTDSPSSKKLEVEKRTELLQLSSLHSSNPAISFPSTTSNSLIYLPPISAHTDTPTSPCRSSSSGFISTKKKQIQRRTELPQSPSLHSNNPVISFPSTASNSLTYLPFTSSYTDTSSSSGTSSSNGFISTEKKQVQRRTESPPSPSLHSSNAVISFPSTASNSLTSLPLLSSYTDTSSSSGTSSSNSFIFTEKKQVQRTESDPSPSLHSRNAVISFPSTASNSLANLPLLSSYTDTSSSSGTSSTNKLVDGNSNDRIVPSLESSTISTQKNKSHDRFVHNRRYMGKRDIAISSASVSSSNVASVFQKQRSRSLLRIEIPSDYAQDTPL